MPAILISKQTPIDLANEYGYLSPEQVEHLRDPHLNGISTAIEHISIQPKSCSKQDFSDDINALLQKVETNEIELTYLRNLVDRHDSVLRQIEDAQTRTAEDDLHC